MEIIVRQRWAVLGLTLMIGCSETKPGSEGSSRTIEVGAANAGTEGEEPTVMFRCEEGRVAAYVVTGPLDGVISAEQMVRINLDSAPGC